MDRIKTVKVKNISFLKKWRDSHMSDALPLFWSSMPSRRITKSKLLTPLDFPPHSPISNQSQNPSQSPQTHLEIFLISAHPSFSPSTNVLGSLSSTENLRIPNPNSSQNLTWLWMCVLSEKHAVNIWKALQHFIALVCVSRWERAVPFDLELTRKRWIKETFLSPQNKSLDAFGCTTCS